MHAITKYFTDVLVEKVQIEDLIMYFITRLHAISLFVSSCELKFRIKFIFICSLRITLQLLSCAC